MPGRQFNSDGYRFGFNGQEKDDEVKGSGNSVDFGARIYDSRLGRWWSVDKLGSFFPDLSTYEMCGNNPIWFLDALGNIIRVYYDGDKYYDYTPAIKPTIENEFLEQVHEAISYVMKNDNTNTFQQMAESSSIVEIHKAKSDGSSAGTHFDADNYEGKATYFSRTGNTSIEWNPNVAMKTYDQFISSSEEFSSHYVTGAEAPSTILFHEALHAFRQMSISSLAEFNKFEADKFTKDPYFDNLEEKRAIELEKMYIKNVNMSSLGSLQAQYEDTQIQGVRNNHHIWTKTDNYKVWNVNTITPTVESVHVPGQQKENWNKKQRMNPSDATLPSGTYESCPRM